MAEEQIKDNDNDTALKRLLLDACVPTKQGEVSIKILAANLGLDFLTPYRWIRNNTIPLNQVKHIVRANNLFWIVMKKSNGQISYDRMAKESDFTPYIKGQNNEF